MTTFSSQLEEAIAGSKKSIPAKEMFQNAAYRFDHSTSKQSAFSALTVMKKAWIASGRDKELKRQYDMRSEKHKNTVEF